MCTSYELRGDKPVLCAECGKGMMYYDIPVHYMGRHWHLSCLLDNLTQVPRLTDNPFSPLGGAGFHP